MTVKDFEASEGRGTKPYQKFRILGSTIELEEYATMLSDVDADSIIDGSIVEFVEFKKPWAVFKTEEYSRIFLYDEVLIEPVADKVQLSKIYRR